MDVNTYLKENLGIIVQFHDRRALKIPLGGRHLWPMDSRTFHFAALSAKDQVSFMISVPRLFTQIGLHPYFAASLMRRNPVTGRLSNHMVKFVLPRFFH